MPTNATTDRFWFWTEDTINGRAYAERHNHPTMAAALAAHKHAREFHWAKGDAYLSELWDDGRTAAPAFYNTEPSGRTRRATR